MYYTIGEMAKKMNMSPHTLRFYAKEGLLPFALRNENGVRLFHEYDYEWFYVIEILKKTNMPLKDIRQFVEWGMQGDETIEDRRQMFINQIASVNNQIAELEDALEVLRYKQWYYETACAAGTADVPENMSREDIPQHLQHVRDRITGIFQNP